jgi:trans-aconitate methyltransferase
MDPAAWQQHWDKVWQEKAPDTVSWFQRRPVASLDQIDATGLGPGTRAIDIGGGASTLVDALLERGFEVAVLDVAAAGLEPARRRLGARPDAVEWIVSDVTRWAPARTYELWHDRAVYHFFVDDPARRAYRDVLARALAPRGHAVFATFAPDGPEKCSGLAVRRASAEMLAVDFEGLLELCGASSETHVTPRGGTQSFSWTRWRRRA